MQKERDQKDNGEKEEVATGKQLEDRRRRTCYGNESRLLFKFTKLLISFNQRNF